MSALKLELDFEQRRRAVELEDAIGGDNAYDVAAELIWLRDKIQQLELAERLNVETVARLQQAGDNFIWTCPAGHSVLEGHPRVCPWCRIVEVEHERDGLAERLEELHHAHDTLEAEHDKCRASAPPDASPMLPGCRDGGCVLRRLHGGKLHMEFCDAIDDNIEGIRKPCNCPVGQPSTKAAAPAYVGNPCICIERLALQANPDCPIHGMQPACTDCGSTKSRIIHEPGCSIEWTARAGHFWRGEINRFCCRNCGRHYDDHLHTDEASTCPVTPV